MHIKVFISLALFGVSALADGGAIQSALENVTQSLTSLKSTIDSVASANDTASIFPATMNVMQALTSATQTTQSSDDLSVGDAIKLKDPAEALTNAAEGVTTSLISKKDLIVQAGGESVALMGLQQQKSASMGLINAVQDKLPKAAQKEAMKITSPSIDALDKAITAFSS